MSKFIKPHVFKYILCSLLSGVLFQACESAKQDDHFSQVKGACDYRIPGGTSALMKDPSYPQKSSLKQECKDELLKVLPFDSSWDQQSESVNRLKDAVMESFQILIGYPLKLPPHKRVLNTSVTIPSAIVCIFDPLSCPEDYRPPGMPSENLNQNIFNFVINNIHVITHRNDPPHEGDMAGLLGVPCVPNELRIYDTFQYDEGGKISWQLNPFHRAGALVHEARHGDGTRHIRGTDGIHRDPELNGPYGMRFIYAELLLHGSYQIKEMGQYILSDFDIFLLYRNSVIDVFENHIANQPKPIEKQINSSPVISEASFMKLENLSRE